MNFAGNFGSFRAPRLENFGAKNLDSTLSNISGIGKVISSLNRQPLEDRQQKTSNQTFLQKSIHDKEESRQEQFQNLVDRRVKCLSLFGMFDTDTKIETANKNHPESEEMKIQRLTREIQESRLLKISATDEEIDRFNQVLSDWNAAEAELLELVEDLSEAEKVNSSYAEDLKKSLSKIANKLSQIDLELSRNCSISRSFLVGEKRILTLTFSGKHEFDAIYYVNEEPYLLNKENVDLQLLSVENSLQFVGLLDNAHIKMHDDSKDPKNSSFSIIQRSKGGVKNLTFQSIITNIPGIVSAIGKTLINTAILLRLINKTVIVPYESTGWDQRLLGAALLGIGGCAIMYSSMIALPLAAIISGVALIFSQSKMVTKVADWLDHIAEKISEIYGEVTKVKDLIKDTSTQDHVLQANFC